MDGWIKGGSLKRVPASACPRLSGSQAWGKLLGIGGGLGESTGLVSGKSCLVELRIMMCGKMLLRYHTIS